MDWIARIIGELLIWLRIMIIPDNNSEPPGNNNTSLHDTLSNIVNRLEALGYISS